MAKIRNTYRGYTAANMKATASVPDQADITVVSSTISCVDITTAKIRSGLIAGTNSVSELCTHANVNHWSAWGPTVRTISAGPPKLLVNSNPTSEYKMGDFAGYNHNAVTPHYTVNGSNMTHLQPSGGSYVFYCIAEIGEIIYTDLGITHVAFSVWDGSTYKDSRVKAISTMTNLADFSTSGADRITVTNITATTTYTCKIEFLNNVAYDYTGANTVCQVAELANWTVQVQIASGNHFFLSGPENDSAEYGSTFTSGKWDVNTATFNTSNGTMMLNYVKLNTLLTGAYNHLHVTAYVQQGYFDGGIWTGTTLTGSYDHLYDGSWNQNTSQAFQVLSPIDIWDIGTAIDTSGYGYRIVIYCNPSTV